MLNNTWIALMALVVSVPLLITIGVMVIRKMENEKEDDFQLPDLSPSPQTKIHRPVPPVRLEHEKTVRMDVSPQPYANDARGHSNRLRNSKGQFVPTKKSSFDG